MKHIVEMRDQPWTPNTYAATVTSGSTERSIASIQPPENLSVPGHSECAAGGRNHTLSAGNGSRAEARSGGLVGRRGKRKGSLGDRRAHVPVRGGCEL